MTLSFELAEDLHTCRAQLTHYAQHDPNLSLNFIEQHDNPHELHFVIKRRNSQLQVVTPLLRGILTTEQRITRLSATFPAMQPVTGVLFLFYLALVAFTGCGLSSRLVVEQRAAPFDYRLEPNYIPVILLVLPGILLIVWSMWLIQQDGQRYLIQSLAACFAQTVDEQLLEKRKHETLRRQMIALLQTSLVIGILALVLGLPLGMTAKIEDYLPPLTIKLTDAHICAVSANDGRSSAQTIFSPTDDIYVCGALGIEIVDQRAIEIPLNFTWYSEMEPEEAGVSSYTFRAEGPVTVLLDKPDSGAYRPGKYSVTVGRNKAQLVELYFEIVE